MKSTHIHDHLTVARLGAIASKDTMLLYLIDMAIAHEAESSRPAKTAIASKVA
jgi:hypothetical protein